MRLRERSGCGYLVRDSLLRHVIQQPAESQHPLPIDRRHPAFPVALVAQFRPRTFSLDGDPAVPLAGWTGFIEGHWRHRFNLRMAGKVY